MIFNSITFFVFFAIILAIYWAAPHRYRNPFLLAGSYLFYGWWDWRFLGLIALSSIVDFTIARRIASTGAVDLRKRLLWTSISINLGILGLFKYFNFFVDSLVDTFAAAGIGIAGPTVDVLLPVGISFYTFQTISYTFDVYRDKVEPTESLLDFATYVAYFPQLVAGPIERASHLLPQITNAERRRLPGAAQRREAGRLILGGLFKKVVLADGVAPVVNSVFDEPGRWSALVLIVGVVGFAIQIYGDFSGYTDIARGVSLLLGINLIVNFTEPYLSRNITEFWRRWHISLSNWLRDYLYIPLGGNREGSAKTYRNLLLTMLLGGLWHGASLTFVVWGLLHGAFLSIHRLVGGRSDPKPPSLGDLPSILGTFTLVCLAWVFFRAETLASAVDIIWAIVTAQPGEVAVGHILTVVILGALTVGIDLWQRFAYNQERTETRFSPELVGVAAALCGVAILVFSGGTPQPFIYFQF